MKGLSNNTKTIATLFLFVCLAANSQIFQSSLTHNTGSSSLASNSLKVEQSSVLPSNADNCSPVPDSGASKEFTAAEKDLVNSEILNKKISDQEEIDDSHLSTRERIKAERERRNARNNNNTSSNKILFKYNFKSYICETEGGSSVTKDEYELTAIETPEGSITCPGGCKYATSQTVSYTHLTLPTKA